MIWSLWIQGGIAGLAIGFVTGTWFGMFVGYRLKEEEKSEQ